jgi:hypothetical protein
MAYDPNDMQLDPELVELAAGGKKPKKSDKEEEKVTAAAAAEPEAPKEEQKIVCFVSRREFLISETVELKYRNQTVRVGKSFVKFA